MNKIFTRDQGEQKEAPGWLANLLDKVILEFNLPFDIEVVLCLFGRLGTELFLDPRLEDILKNENKDRLNNRVAGKTFTDLHLCYLCLYRDLTLTIHHLLHELHHFQDTFKCSTSDKADLKKLICTHLNDFYAEYYAVKKMIDLRYNDGKEGIHLLLIIHTNLAYLGNNEQFCKEKITEILERELSDNTKQLNIIYFLQHYIIKDFLFFLANYRAFQERGFCNRLYENHYIDFTSNKIRPTLANLLMRIKQRIMDGNLDLIKQSSELKDFLDEYILDFYNNNFNEYLSELFEKRDNLPLFPPLQELTLTRNYSLFEQLQIITRGFNLEWMKTFQRLQESLMRSIAEPLSKISKLTQKLIFIPKFKLNIHNNDTEQDENSD